MVCPTKQAPALELAQLLFNSNPLHTPIIGNKGIVLKASILTHPKKPVKKIFGPPGAAGIFSFGCKFRK
jgi:hypothetical protein